VNLSRVTSGFVLSAAVTVLFNTALACAKDAYAPLNTSLASITGHHWTTHGLLDLALFAVLGWIFARTGAAEKIPSGRLITILIACVAIAAAGMGLWYVLV
jgi:hypothetical protein